MILVSLQASFVGGPTDAEDKANILAFGDPMVDLTGGLFVDNYPVPEQAASAVIQGITFTTTIKASAANLVTINFISSSLGSPDASAISVAGTPSPGDAVTVDVNDSTTSMIRNTSAIVTLFYTYPPTTTHGGPIVASGGSGVAAMTTSTPISLTGGAPAYTAAFQFEFPASHLYVGVTTQMQGYTARFMTQLPPAPRGIPEEHWEYDHLRHHGYHTRGSLDCVTSDPQRASTAWINAIEIQIAGLFAVLRAKSPLGPQTPYTV